MTRRANPDEITRAWRRRLGIGPTEGPLPTGWKPWCEPKPRLSIDEQVTDLVDRGVLNKKYFAEPCPYAAARRSLHHAGLIAYVKKEEADLVRAPHVDALKQFKALAPSLDQKLADALKVIAKLRVPDGTLDGDIGAHDLALRDLEDALLISKCGLEKLRPVLADAHVTLSQNQGHIDRLAFVLALGGCWCRLTGREPTTGEAFKDFITAGWITLHPDGGDEFSWDSAIRTVCTRNRGAWPTVNDGPPT